MIKLLLDLYITFAKVGGFTFGGGYAMLPMLRAEVVEKKKWATEEEIMDYYAIGQCTPGIIAVNTATFIGYKTAGILGGIFATLGVVSPSILIISLIGSLINNFSDLEVVQNALSAIRVCVFVLVLSAVIKLGKKSLTNTFSIVLYAIIFALALFTNISTIILIVAAAIIGLIYGNISMKRMAAKDEEVTK